MPPRYIKIEGTPSLQSVTKGSYKYRSLKKFFPYIKSMVRFKNMQKNSGEIFTSIEVDTVTGEYYTVIPEAVVNDLGWFEETPLKWSIDGKEAIITEQN